MNGFDPGPGWREVTDSVYRHSLGQPRLLSTDGSQGEGTRYWVRETPVPPLPTAPYTVIRVTESTDPDIVGQVLTFDGGRYWSNSGHTLGPASMDRRVQAFEVLSEPRAVTAKAVLDRLAEMTAPANILTGGAYHDVGREFGVES